MGNAGIIVKLALAAVKAGVMEEGAQALVRAVVSKALDLAGEGSLQRLESYMEKSSREIGGILQRNGLERLHICHMDYVQAEIGEFIRRLQISEDIPEGLNFDADRFRKFLWEEFQRVQGKSPEYEEEIKRVLGEIAAKSIRIVREDKEFVPSLLINVNAGIKDIKTSLGRIEGMVREKEPMPVLGKKQGLPDRYGEYLRRWEENMFLNDFDGDEEGAGVNIALRELYLLPSYKLGENRNPSDNLKERLEGYLEARFKKKEQRMLFIQGQPGIGKTTLLTWLANQHSRRIQCRRKVLIYRFTDFKQVDWSSRASAYDFTEELLKELGLTKAELEDTVLVLDGFDEVDMKGSRVEFLNALYDGLILNQAPEGFSLMITCRENYVPVWRLSCTTITLEPWDRDKIEAFYRTYKKKTNAEVKEREIGALAANHAILGIPLILYMTMALDIVIEIEDDQPAASSIAKVYERIFSLEGGIYDRCIQLGQRKKWEDTHRISRVKEKIHQASQRLAFWIFENNPEEAGIPRKEYMRILSGEENAAADKSNLGRDVFIGNYFKLVRHCEGVDTEKLYFIHRSVYEYFTADFIFASIRGAMEELTAEGVDKFMKRLIPLLKRGRITREIRFYTIYKIMQLPVYRQNPQGLKKWLSVTLHHLDDNPLSLRERARCFANLLDLFYDCYSGTDYVYDLLKAEGAYDRYGLDVLNAASAGETLKLRGWDLRDYNLCGANLEHADLGEADLTGSRLDRADLEYANLEGAYLGDTSLEGARLKGARLKGTRFSYEKLLKINFDGVDLLGAYLLQKRGEEILIDQEYLDTHPELDAIRFRPASPNLPS